MQSVIERVALEVKRLHAQLIEKIKLARATLVAEERRASVDTQNRPMIDS